MWPCLSTSTMIMMKCIRTRTHNPPPYFQLLAPPQECYESMKMMVSMPSSKNWHPPPTCLPLYRPPSLTILWLQYLRFGNFCSGQPATVKRNQESLSHWLAIGLRHPKIWKSSKRVALRTSPPRSMRLMTDRTWQQPKDEGRHLNKQARPKSSKESIPPNFPLNTGFHPGPRQLYIHIQYASEYPNWRKKKTRQTRTWYGAKENNQSIYNNKNTPHTQ